MADEVEVFVLKGPDLWPAAKLDSNDAVVAHLVSAANVATMKLLLSEIKIPEEEEVWFLREYNARLYWVNLKAEDPPTKVADQIHVFHVKPSVPARPSALVPAGPSALGSSGNIESYIKSLGQDISKSIDQHYKVISKGLTLALRPTFSQLRRTLSAERSDESVRDADLKKNLVRIFYGIDSQSHVLECPITKLRLPSTEVRAAHIYPMRAMETLADFCPDIPNINHTSNCMLWAEPIEQAFEISCICFSWSVEDHTLTPTVLDRNLLGKTMLEANRYMKGKSDQEMVPAKEMLLDEMEQNLRKEMAQISASKLTKKKKEQLRHKCEAHLQPHVDLLYTKISFDDINGKAIKLPENVELSQRAFELTAALAWEEAKKRNVLPEGLEQRVQYGGDPGLLDLFLASQDVCFEYMDDFSDSASSIESIECGPSEYVPLSVGSAVVRAATYH